MNIGRLVMVLAIGMIALWVLGNLLSFAVGLLFQIVVPILVVGVVGYVLYLLVFRGTLPGGSRETLP